LPQPYQQCMQPNKWRSASPAAAFDSLVALRWLMHHKKESLATQGINIDDFKLNSFLVPHSIIMLEGNKYHFVLATARCGALLWALELVEIPEDIEGNNMYFRMGQGGDAISFFFVVKEMEILAGPWSATTPLEAQPVLPANSTPEILLTFKSQPEHFIAFALRHNKSISLVKRDLIALLKDLGLEPKKGATKKDLIKNLVHLVFEGEDPEVVEAILAALLAVRKSQDEEMVERLEKDENLTEAIEMLATMGEESAQAFPEITKTLKAKRSISRKRAREPKEQGGDGTHAEEEHSCLLCRLCFCCPESALHTVLGTCHVFLCGCHAVSGERRWCCSSTLSSRWRCP
jgi:hypothetical protein